jgi:DNA-binding beta-propeller fold protein YncE
LISSPACTTKVAAAAPKLTAVRTKMIELAGSPFGVATTRGGRWSFVDELGPRTAVAVFSDTGAWPRLVRTVDLHAQAVGSSLTADERYLLSANGGNGAVVLSVARLESGKGNPVLGTLAQKLTASSRRRGPLGGGAIETASSLDGRFAFVSVEYGDAVAVYDLRAALADGFSRSSYIGAVPLGQAVVGMAVSHDGRWLYVTSELQAGSRSLSKPGTLSVISIPTAETHPAHSVMRTVAAGCQPVRVAVSSDGRTVWVTARASDALLAFSASRLLSSPKRALLAAVRVGEAPVGLALVGGGRDVVVADSNRFGAPGAHFSLTVVDSARALAHEPSVVGSLPAGAFPREMAATPNGRLLLVGNFGSSQLEAVSVSALP